MSDSFDVAIIGGGPGGYVCAIKCAQLGLKVCLIEKRSTFGGTCLNVGCIPSKALLHTSELFADATHNFANLGIKTSKPKVDLAAMMQHKDKVVGANVNGVAFLLKKNKVTTYTGIGSIKEAGKVQLTKEDGNQQILNARSIVIATGSEVAGIPGVAVEIDEKKIISSTGALSLNKVPKSMLVVGGGVIGLELGSVWNRLGAKVHVVEYMDKILGNCDKELSKHALRLLKKQGLEINLSSKVTSLTTGRSGVTAAFEAAKGGSSQSLEVDIVLVATGRQPYIEHLGLENLGIKTKKGRIETDQHWQTNIPHIYAIGDVTDGPMLAHKAEEEGVALAEHLAGQAGHVNYDIIPSVVYTHPEIASVGMTEEELRATGIEYNVGKFNFLANGRARAMDQTDGFVKILSDKQIDKVLGVHILGFGAGEMIHEAAVLMEFSGSSEDLARTCHAHPTLSEAVKEAAMAAYDKPIHS